LTVQQPPTPQVTERRLGVGGELVVIGITRGALGGIGLIAGAILYSWSEREAEGPGTSTT